MPVQIVEQKPEIEYLTQCSYCEALLSFQPGDVLFKQVGNYPYQNTITCPGCNGEVFIGMTTERFVQPKFVVPMMKDPSIEQLEKRIRELENAVF